MLMNEQGEVTSHLMGTFYRTLRMVDHGIKPAYVFDGKPPDLKSGVVRPLLPICRRTRRDGSRAGSRCKS
jgi:flap endonuclease-1